ncbi:uncharacterized protein LOC127278543 [Leptopilina boulardi]|uniref:uncharacterized protein LOC127278543 n=1 Tax=Leptopilina boulardi TaxID=63433 RepID=UPI0021F5E4D9|nr:uncharacterized protein LOC127278543 [Leptopilina boulardi]
MLFTVQKSTKMLLSKVNRVEMYMKQNKQREKENSPQRLSFLEPDNDLKMFPLKNLVEVNRMETKLLSKSFFGKLVTALADLRSSSTHSMTVANMLYHLLTYEAGQSFTYKGKSAKKTCLS